MSNATEKSGEGAVVLLGLDIGRKRTGLALAQDNITTEHETLTSLDTLIDEVKRICQNQGVTTLVVGLPLNHDHTESEQSAWVREWAQRIEQDLQLPVILEDEYLTSWEAQRQLKALGLSDEQISQRIDARSAKILLDQYLANQ